MKAPNGTKKSATAKRAGRPKIAIVPAPTVTSEDVTYDLDMCRALGLRDEVMNPPTAADVAIGMLKTILSDLDVLHDAMLGDDNRGDNPTATVTFRLRQRVSMAIEIAERLKHEAKAAAVQGGAS